MRLRLIGTAFKYVLGVLCWFILFGLLRYYCILNISPVIDGLWMKKLHDGLVENAIGDIAFHVGGGDCNADHYLYWVRYNPSELDLDGEPRSLNSLVDVATWNYVGWETVTVTYQDAKHRYVLYTISDDNFMLAADR